MPARRLTAARLAAAVLAAILAGLSAPAGAQGLPGAATATVSGSVRGVPTAGTGAATVRVFDGDRGTLVTAARPTAAGRFSVALPEGGAFVLSTSIIVPGASVSTAAQPISVRPGQRRKGLRLVPKRPRKATKGKRRATRAAAGRGRRAFVQESGAVTAGVPAFSVEQFTGGTGDWSVLNRGLADMLTTDLVGGTPCETAVVANAQDRAMILKELRLQRSRFFDPASRVKRNFVIADYRVTGSLTVVPGSSGASAVVTAQVVNARTGAIVDAIRTTLTQDGLFEEAQQLAKVIGERVCRRPAAYEVTLSAQSDGDFATHRASGSTVSLLTALRSGGEPGRQATAWSGVAQFEWTGLTASSKTDCFYTNGVSPTVPWQATIAVQGEEQIKVDWTTAGFDIATFTANCPDSEGRVVSIPGSPGPSLVGVTPESFILPLLGGTIPLAGGIRTAQGGWTDSGSITVRPVWTNDLPK